MPVVGLADVAGRADREVELAVGAEGDEAAAVMGVVGQAVGEAHRVGGPVEAVVDAVVAPEGRQGGDPEAAVAVGDAGRQRQVRGDRVDPGRHGVELDRVNLARRRRADVDDAGAAERHRARVRDAVGDELDPKARRRTQRLEVDRGDRRRRGQAGAEDDRRLRDERRQETETTGHVRFASIPQACRASASTSPGARPTRPAAATISAQVTESTGTPCARRSARIARSGSPGVSTRSAPATGGDAVA